VIERNAPYADLYKGELMNMTLKKLINSNKSLTLVKSIIENISCKPLQLASANSEKDELFDSAIVTSISAYYDDLFETDFINSHIPPRASVQYSDLTKLKVYDKRIEKPVKF
jgi:hypothetical protein